MEATTGQGEIKMKPAKKFYSGVLVMLMAMAFVGVPSGAAETTALCNEDPGNGVCSAGHYISHIHETTLSGNKAILLSSIVEIKCDVLLLRDAEDIFGPSLASPLEITGHFTYSNCKTASGSSCTVTEVSTASKVKVLKLGHELADVTGTGEVNAKCGFFINCTYDGSGLSGHGLGPLLSSEQNGEIRLEEQVVHKTAGSFCPETAKLDILTTSLEVGYVTE
jgi:hypothetical protein